MFLQVLLGRVSDIVFVDVDNVNLVTFGGKVSSDGSADACKDKLAGQTGVGEVTAPTLTGAADHNSRLALEHVVADTLTDVRATWCARARSGRCTVAEKTVAGPRY